MVHGFGECLLGFLEKTNGILIGLNAMHALTLHSLRPEIQSPETRTPNIETVLKP